MIRKFLEKSKHTLLNVFVFVIVLEIVLYFWDGYCTWDCDSSFILLILFPIRFILIFLAFAQVIHSIIRKMHHWKYSILCILLVCISVVPKGHYVTLGKITHIYNAGPTSVLVDVRNLMNTYEPLTHFGRPHRNPLHDPRPLNQVPKEIKNFHKGEILVLENAVLLERGDIFPSFRGFVVFREGFDPWIDDKQIVLKDFWWVGWKVRIIDDLYWYSVNGHDLILFLRK